MELIERPVDDVATALGHHTDLCARGAAEIRTGVSSDGAEFLYRIERNTQHAGESTAVLLIVDVDAVEHNIGLIRFPTVHRTATIVV